MLDFEITAGNKAGEVTPELTFTDASGQPVAAPVQVRQGFWRYQRPLGVSTMLRLNANELRAVDEGQPLRLDPRLSRRVNLLVARPPGSKSHNRSWATGPDP